MRDRNEDFGDDLDNPEEGDIMAGDRRIAREDSALPDWYVSDAAYRPIPIAWFAGALILQVIVQPTLFMLLHVGFGLGNMLTFAFCMLATGLIWHLTWERGMAQAGKGWQIATAVMLAFFLLITALGLGLLG